MNIFRNSAFAIIIALLAGFGLGLAYSWLIAPVEYVNANPSILRSDFKDQYRIVIAASYASTHDLPRARARLELLGDADPIGQLSAQAQQMLASGETFERIRPLAQLATDLQQGFVAIPFTSTPFTSIGNTPIIEETPFIEEPFPTETPDFSAQTIIPNGIPFETPLIPQTNFTPTPRPTFTSIPQPGAPFTLVGQDVVCDPALSEGLMQVMLMDGRRRQVAGIKIIVTWDNGEDQFFTGLKPELGNGYADFLMDTRTIYSIRVVEGGTFVPNLVPPTCTDSNGGTYFGGLLLTFQQP